MTQARERTATLSAQVAEEVRALLARRRVSGRQLAIQLGVSPSWVSYRLTGAQEIGLDDMQRIANALGVPVLELMPAAVRRGQSRVAGTSDGEADLNASLRGSDRSVPEPSPEQPRRRPREHVAPRPFSPGRQRDPERPVSAIPATKRRPQHTRPGNRLMTLRG